MGEQQALDFEAARVISPVGQWLDSLTNSNVVCYLKRLSANDTGATGAHQVGLYVPRAVVNAAFTEVVAREAELNPKRRFQVHFDSHGGGSAEVVLTWYNNRLFDGTRNEFRFTGWGGRSSPVQDPDSTGSLCVFAFPLSDNDEPCRVWLCGTPAEEEIVESRCGAVEPGEGRMFFPNGEFAPNLSRGPKSCSLHPQEIPDDWLIDFPRAETVVEFAIGRCAHSRKAGVDDRLMARRDCEYEVFLSIERELVLPRVKEGFATVDAFVNFAGQVTNRRKARAGRSLELQLVRIFDEEQVHFSHGQVSENEKRPDFLFPSAEAYQRSPRGAGSIRMLAAKTTCKDRWRQVIDEAEKIPLKHLLTLQEGVSPTQYAQMKDAGVRLVVPRKLHRAYPEEVRGELMALEDFVREVRSLGAST